MFTLTLPCGCQIEDPNPYTTDSRFGVITPNPDCWEHVTGTIGSTTSDLDADDDILLEA